MSRWSRAMWGALAAVLVAGSVAFLAPALPAAGQQANCPPPDPYSGGEQCPRQITLSLSLQFGPAGVRVRIRAFGFNAGDPVTGTFDGVVMFTATARADTGQTAMAQPTFAAAGLNALRGLFAQTTAGEAGGIDETITVPDKPVGPYAICVSGSGAQACGEFRITATEVAGVTFTRGDNVTGSSGTKVSGGTQVLGRQYARTGVAIAALVFAAVILIVLGRFLRVASRRRRISV